MYIAIGQGQTTPRGQNFVVNRNLLSLRSFATSLKKISLKSDFIHIFFMILYMYIHVAPEQGLTTSWRRNFDVNWNILSLRSFVASFKKIFLKFDFIQFLSLYIYIAQGQGQQPQGDRVLMSTETSLFPCCKFQKNPFKVWFYTFF